MGVVEGGELAAVWHQAPVPLQAAAAVSGRGSAGAEPRPLLALLARWGAAGGGCGGGGVAGCGDCGDCGGCGGAGAAGGVLAAGEGVRLLWFPPAQGVAGDVAHQLLAAPGQLLVASHSCHPHDHLKLHSVLTW